MSQKIEEYTYIYMYVLVCAKSLQSCPTLREPMDCSPPGSSVHGILQARILERVAISFSRNIYVCVYTHAHIYRYLSTYVPNIYIYLHLFVCYYFSPVPNLEEVDWFTLNFVGLGKEENWSLTYYINKYWKATNQANKWLSKICPLLLLWQLYFHDNPGGQV